MVEWFHLWQNNGEVVHMVTDQADQEVEGVGLEPGLDMTSQAYPW